MWRSRWTSSSLAPVREVYRVVDHPLVQSGVCVGPQSHDRLKQNRHRERVRLVPHKNTVVLCVSESVVSTLCTPCRGSEL